MDDMENENLLLCQKIKYLETRNGNLIGQMGKLKAKNDKLKETIEHLNQTIISSQQLHIEDQKDLEDEIDDLRDEFRIAVKINEQLRGMLGDKSELLASTIIHKSSIIASRDQELAATKLECADLRTKLEKRSQELQAAKSKATEMELEVLELAATKKELADLRIKFEKMTQELQEVKSKVTVMMAQKISEPPGPASMQYETLRIQFRNYRTNKESKIAELRDKIKVRDQIIINYRKQLETLTKELKKAQEHQNGSELAVLGVEKTEIDNAPGPVPLTPGSGNEIEVPTGMAHRLRSTTKRSSANQPNVETGAGAGNTPVKKSKK